MRLNIINLIENFNIFNNTMILNRTGSGKKSFQITLSSCSEILQNCQGYLIFEEKLEGSLKLFNRLLTSGEKGIIITRNHPDKLVSTIANTHQNNVDTWWLSAENFDYVIRPWEIDLLINTVRDFSENNRSGVILFNGLEYLSTYNDYEEISRFINNLIDIVGFTNIKILITIDPLALDNNFLFNFENNSEITFIPTNFLKEVFN